MYGSKIQRVSDLVSKVLIFQRRLDQYSLGFLWSILHNKSIDDFWSTIGYGSKIQQVYKNTEITNTHWALCDLFFAICLESIIRYGSKIQRVSDLVSKFWYLNANLTNTHWAYCDPFFTSIFVILKRITQYGSKSSEYLI